MTDQYGGSFEKYIQLGCRFIYMYTYINTVVIKAMKFTSVDF